MTRPGDILHRALANPEATAYAEKVLAIVAAGESGNTARVFDLLSKLPAADLEGFREAATLIRSTTIMLLEGVAVLQVDGRFVHIPLRDTLPGGTTPEDRLGDLLSQYSAGPARDVRNEEAPADDRPYGDDTCPGDPQHRRSSHYPGGAFYGVPESHQRDPETTRADGLPVACPNCGSRDREGLGMGCRDDWHIMGDDTPSPEDRQAAAARVIDRVIMDSASVTSSDGALRTATVFVSPTAEQVAKALAHAGLLSRVYRRPEDFG